MSAKTRGAAASLDSGIAELSETRRAVVSIIKREGSASIQEIAGEPRLTVSTLTRLLGHRVVREQRFQDGDGKCVFRVRPDLPAPPESFRFEFEE